MERNIAKRAFRASVFHRYDIRGLYPEELDHNTLELIAGAFAEYLRRLDGRTALVGRDIRWSSEEISELVQVALLREGIDVIDIGMVSTPLFTFAMGKSEAAGGIMVTASHNSIRYNGLKLYQGTGTLSERKGLQEIKQIIETGGESYSGRQGWLEKKNFTPPYTEFLASSVSLKRKVKAVFDAGGGAVSVVLPEFLKRMKTLEAQCLLCDPDPSLIKRELNPMLPEAQRQARSVLLEKGAEAAFIFDPDGDRVIALDEKGQAVSGDALLWLLATHLIEPGESVVYDDIRASRALREDLEERGIRCERSRVGHSFIKETMRESDAVLGGEISGHFYFKEFFFAESALLTCLKVLQILSEDSRPLSVLIEPYSRYVNSGEINFTTENKSEILSHLAEKYQDGKLDYFDGLKVEYPSWWFSARPSGTEDLLRVVLEARNKKTFEEKKEELFSLLKDQGAVLT